MKRKLATFLMSLSLVAAMLAAGCQSIHSALNSTVGATSGGTLSISDRRQRRCTMDIQCGVGAECSEGVCTGGIGPQMDGECVRGDFGRQVCSNNGERCSIDADCIAP